jgi:pimeloyl-ACP methyl ester carboxylesterase
LNKLIKTLLITTLLGIGLLVLGPFLIPVAPLATRPPQELADPDSIFVDVNNLKVHYKTSGTGQPVIILLHGFGASVYSWREVITPLSELGTVIAFDRPAFGLTERPLVWETGKNPYSPEGQVDLLIGLMDNLDIDQAVLVGNSAGGTVALNTALSYPDRVTGLVLVDAAVYQGGGSPPFLRPVLNTPQMDHIGPLIARRISLQGDDFIAGAWSNPSLISEEIYQGYRKPLQTDNWDRALWELTKASQKSKLPEKLSEITISSLVISGEDDQIVPVEYSVKLSRDLPDAVLAIYDDCGHLPQEECPDLFLESMKKFIDDLSQ